MPTFFFLAKKKVGRFLFFLKETEYFADEFRRLENEYFHNMLLSEIIISAERKKYACRDDKRRFDYDKYICRQKKGKEDAEREAAKSDSDSFIY